MGSCCANQFVSQQALRTTGGSARGPAFRAREEISALVACAIEESNSRRKRQAGPPLYRQVRKSRTSWHRHDGFGGMRRSSTVQRYSRWKACLFAHVQSRGREVLRSSLFGTC